MKVDFYASAPHYLDHMSPIWKALPPEYKGKFYITPEILNKALALSLDYTIGRPTQNLTVVASYGDYRKAKGPVIFMEHGIGHTYSNQHPSYAGGLGKSRVVLFLNQHYHTDTKNRLTYTNTKGVVIGTPKMDPILPMQVTGRTVCIAFHWNCQVAPETMSAYPHYAEVLPLLAKDESINLILHGHPNEEAKWQTLSEELNIPYYKDFKDVMQIADMYVNDNSSTMYEFAYTGKPVVVLNAPWYRRKVKHGIRFWDYIPGPQVNEPNELIPTIHHLLDNPEPWKSIREKIIHVLYPFKGEATQHAVTALTSFLDSWNGHYFADPREDEVFEGLDTNI